MNIDAILGTRNPNPALRLMLRMAKTLVRDAPAKQNEPVIVALGRLIKQIEIVSDALSRRLRQSNPHIVARELEFDRALDALWVLLRSYLAQLGQAYGHPGLDSLSLERKKAIGLDELRELAAKATSIHEQLFAAEGTAFTKYKMPAQAEAMAVLLRIIEQDELQPLIHETTGEVLLGAIVVCQAQYEEIVAERMRREVGVSENLREHRTRLRWLIGRYKAAVETLYDEEQPETEAIVEDALRSLLMVSAHMLRSPSAGLDEALDEALVEEEAEFSQLDEVDGVDDVEEPPMLEG